MEHFTNNTGPLCPADQHCALWARKYIKYCLCSVKDAAGLSLGLISVISWGFAEVPQIITNYKLKANEGLSIAFLATWMVGDILNLLGCMLEPATLPSQYYIAWLYTVNTMILFGQTIYYGHIYPRLKSKQQLYKADGADRLANVSETSDQGNVGSSPIPLPDRPTHALAGQGLYYISARSLSSSHTPTAGYLTTHRMSPSTNGMQSTVAEPLLAAVSSTPSTTPPKRKNIFSLLAGVTVFGTSNLHYSGKGRSDVGMASGNLDGSAMSMGRKVLQVNHGSPQGNSWIGTSLGWGMAAIYMGGRLPQICLNIRRGNVEGLNPMMFLFALFGNITYVASILVSSLEWSKLRPNLPWLVDAGGCVLLDTFIIIQFVYFCFWSKTSLEK